MVGLTASVVLAVFGTTVLVGYVQSAKDSAGAAEPTVPVLVVARGIDRGTKAADLGSKVKVRQVPADDKVDGAVSSVEALTGKVASTDLVPGEQVLADRFVTPRVLGRAGVPKGLLEVTVKLEPERAVGGSVSVGDKVAVLASFEPFDIDNTGDPVDSAGPKKTPNTTHLILHDVLVTRVQADSTVRSGGNDNKDDASKPDPAPKGTLLVTLALDAPSVERVVFAAEYGKLWLSAEPPGASAAGTAIQTRGSIYR
jgi:pilus assembly protein CpaB